MLLFLLFRLRFLADSLKVQTSERYKNKNTPKNIVTDRSTISTTTPRFLRGSLFLHYLLLAFILKILRINQTLICCKVRPCNKVILS